MFCVYNYVGNLKKKIKKNCQPTPCGVWARLVASVSSARSFMISHHSRARPAKRAVSLVIILPLLRLCCGWELKHKTEFSNLVRISLVWLELRCTSLWCLELRRMHLFTVVGT